MRRGSGLSSCRRTLGVLGCIGSVEFCTSSCQLVTCSSLSCPLAPLAGVTLPKCHLPSNPCLRLRGGEPRLRGERSSSFWHRRGAEALVVQGPRGGAVGQGGAGSQGVREGEEGNGQGPLALAWSAGLGGLWVLVLRARVWI